MATESIDIIQHLLEVENEAAQMQLDAQKQADEKLARVRSESDARYKSECAENARILESEEKAKIQQSSIFIQVMDTANMPDVNNPSGPKKTLLVAIGFMIGCVIALGYGLILYKREA